jgi:hypothetical protein
VYLLTDVSKRCNFSSLKIGPNLVLIFLTKEQLAIKNESKVGGLSTPEEEPANIRMPAGASI